MAVRLNLKRRTETGCALDERKQQCSDVMAGKVRKAHLERDEKIQEEKAKLADERAEEEIRNGGNKADKRGYRLRQPGGKQRGRRINNRAAVDYAERKQRGNVN